MSQGVIERASSLAEQPEPQSKSTLARAVSTSRQDSALPGGAPAAPVPRKTILNYDTFMHKLTCYRS